MKTTRQLVMLGLLLTSGAGQQLFAAEDREADSVYSYGRWAVLSPAAGGIEPYVATATPDAVNNTRPEEPFGPVTIGIDTTTPPPVIDDPRDRPPPPVLPQIDDPRDRPPPPSAAL